jgi:hypothetical protein
MDSQRLLEPKANDWKISRDGEQMRMTGERRDGLILLLMGALAFVILGIAWQRISRIEMGDFKVVYYGARVLIQNGDPYNERDALRVYHAEERELPFDSQVDTQAITRFFYPPTALAFTVPFAALGSVAAKTLWLILSAGSLILAAILTWDLAAGFAPVLSGALLGFMLANSIWLFLVCNSAGIVISFCAIATWCFLRERYIGAGILCLAISLALKPNDAALVWLFFLLAGGTLRKRALQTAAVVVVLSLPAVLWVTHVAPHWPQELKANMAIFTGVGGMADPAVTGMAGRNMDCVVELQSDVSIFFGNPGTYNLITYAIWIPLMLVWAFFSLRMKPGRARSLLALAAIAPLTMLPSYHLQHDAKLMMLSIPACAMLWARRGWIGWSAMLITGAGVVINGDMFSGARVLLTHAFIIPEPNFTSRLTTVLLTRQAPLIVFAMAIFFLIAMAMCYLERSRTSSGRSMPESTSLPAQFESH